MTDGLTALCVTAASIGLIHTLIGPDHYVPFIAMARAGRWSMVRTIWVTILCGAGHVLSSAVLGSIGIAFGAAVFKLERIESARGTIAGWLLLGFGLVYLLWGLRRAVRDEPHTHVHVHADGTIHEHQHTHTDEHLHVHHAERAIGNPQSAIVRQAHDGVRNSQFRTQAWVLFTIFLFGPCEPLIPLLMFPAARGSLSGVVLVTTVFGLVTIASMTAAVVLGTLGLRRIRHAPVHRFGHAAAGSAIMVCGLVVVLGA